MVNGYYLQQQVLKFIAVVDIRKLKKMLVVVLIRQANTVSPANLLKFGSRHMRLKLNTEDAFLLHGLLACKISINNV